MAFMKGRRGGSTTTSLPFADSKKAKLKALRKLKDEAKKKQYKHGNRKS